MRKIRKEQLKASVKTSPAKPFYNKAELSHILGDVVDILCNEAELVDEEKCCVNPDPKVHDYTVRYVVNGTITVTSTTADEAARYFRHMIPDIEVPYYGGWDEICGGLEYDVQICSIEKEEPEEVVEDNLDEQKEPGWDRWDPDSFRDRRHH